MAGNYCDLKKKNPLKQLKELKIKPEERRETSVTEST